MPDRSHYDHESYTGPPLAPVEPESTNWRAWLLGACFSVMLLFGGVWFQALNSRIDTLERYGSPPFRERMAAIEERQLGLQRQQDMVSTQMRDTMRRIEAKLDQTLEKISAHIEKGR